MLRLKEAFARARDLSLVRRKKDFALELWPDSSLGAAYTNFSNLEDGKTQKIKIEAVPLICERLGCTPEYLFGMSEIPSREESKAQLKELAKQMIEIIDKL